jgi:hypothetical protein
LQAKRRSSQQKAPQEAWARPILTLDPPPAVEEAQPFTFLKPEAFRETYILDRNALRRQLIALFQQYRGDAESAQAVIAEATKALEAAREGMSVVRKLLDIEFPDWDTM